MAHCWLGKDTRTRTVEKSTFIELGCKLSKQNMFLEFAWCLTLTVKDAQGRKVRLGTGTGTGVNIFGNQEIA